MLVCVVKNVLSGSLKVRQEKVLLLITKEVGMVQPGEVKAAAPRASCYNPGRGSQCRLRVEVVKGPTKDCSLS